MNKAEAVEKLEQHKKMLKETKDDMKYFPSSATKDAISILLPMLEAEAEVMQAIVNAMD